MAIMVCIYCMSLGFENDNPALKEILKELGLICVAASGNDGNHPVTPVMTLCTSCHSKLPYLRKNLVAAKALI